MESAPANTKDAILDAAERLFAAQGLDAVSLRQITAEAGVNLASVHYHFGSKDALIQAVLDRRIVPLNEERFRLLGVFEAEAGERPPTLEKVFEALAAPALRLSRSQTPGCACFMRILGRLFTEPNEHFQKLVLARYGHVFDRFVGALRRSSPDLADEDFFWRVHFAMGALCHTMGQQDQVRALSGGRCDPEDVEALIGRLIGFLAAGFGAPPVSRRKKRRKEGET